SGRLCGKSSKAWSPAGRKVRSLRSCSKVKLKGSKRRSGERNWLSASRIWQKMKSIGRKPLNGTHLTGSNGRNETGGCVPGGFASAAPHRGGQSQTGIDH